jgi:hypothetical protein
MIRATASGPGVDRANYSGIDQEPIPSHVRHIPGLGDVLFHHAEAVNVATVTVEDSFKRIALILAKEGCQCGCGARGRGLILTPDVRGARTIASQLNAMADKVEKEAIELACATIARLRGQ